MELFNKRTLIQLIKYGIVGLSNTAVTALVIFVLLKLAGMNDTPANLLGYVAGVINSFIWNSRWTFRAAKGAEVNSTAKDSTVLFDRYPWLREFLLFIAAFLICYVLQYILLLWLNRNFTQWDSYINHLIGMAFFTLINFPLNKFVSFRSREQA